MLPKHKQRVLKGHRDTVYTVRFNKDGDYCMTAGQDKSIRLWNPHKGTLIKSYIKHSYEVLSVDIVHDNSQFASCGGDRQPFVWDVATGEIIRKFKGHERRINTIKYNLDGSVVITGSYDKSVKVWDCRSRNAVPIQEMLEARDSVSSIVVSDSEIIAASVDGCVRTYDVRAGQLRTERIGQPVTSVALSGDGNCILASCLDSGLRLLDKSTGELLNQYRGHQNTQYRVDAAFSNTDGEVLCGSDDGKVYVWDLVNADVTATLRGHSRAVLGMAYHPTSAMLLTSSVDSTVIVWAASEPPAAASS